MSITLASGNATIAVKSELAGSPENYTTDGYNSLLSPTDTEVITSGSLSSHIATLDLSPKLLEAPTIHSGLYGFRMYDIVNFWKRSDVYVTKLDIFTQEIDIISKVVMENAEVSPASGVYLSDVYYVDDNIKPSLTISPAFVGDGVSSEVWVRGSSEPPAYMLPSIPLHNLNTTHQILSGVYCWIEE